MVNVRIVELQENITNEVEFPIFSGKFLVKNWSDDEVLFNYTDNFPNSDGYDPNDAPVIVGSMLAENIEYNERNWSNTTEQACRVYLQGKGKVEIRMLSWSYPELMV